jgi:hypothetical protein
MERDSGKILPAQLAPSPLCAKADSCNESVAENVARHAAISAGI